MKKSKLFLVMVVFFMFVSVAWADVSWFTANQKTVMWDAVTTNTSGGTIPDTDTIEYVLYLSNTITDPSKSNPAEVGTTTELTYTITLNVEGLYYVGIKSVRKLPDGVIAGESEVVWSDNPLYVSNGNTFGLRYFLPPSIISGFRPVQ